jgi:RNase adapter protein RapZ
MSMVRSTELFVITGFSGAGKSTVLRALEDAGFFCVDNLPCVLLGSFLQFMTHESMIGRRIALGIDIRSGNDMQAIVADLERWRDAKGGITILFLSASPAVLIKRFQETRRKHPLADGTDLADAIHREKELLVPLSACATTTINTDQLSLHELRSLVRHVLVPSAKPRMMVTLISFGFKYGIPSESTLIFDLRSLPNPYFRDDLQALDGRNHKIRDYLFEQEDVRIYWHKLLEFFTFNLERSYREGRYFMHVALGCTGGRHRSVALVEELAKLPIEYVQFFVKHRDVHRETPEKIDERTNEISHSVISQS